jgi:hypothetical protein
MTTYNVLLINFMQIAIETCDSILLHNVQRTCNLLTQNMVKLITTLPKRPF